jgi:site-specific recombinase XerD
MILARGLRCVEMSRLEMSEIDFQRQTISVRGKADNGRTPPLIPAAADALDYLGRRGIQPGPLL